MMVRARELSHADLGRNLLLEKVAEPLADLAKIDTMPRRDGRRMSMVLTPLPSVKTAANKRKADQLREREKEKEREKGHDTPPDAPPAEDDSA
jgi:translation initiation factor IF-3